MSNQEVLQKQALEIMELMEDTVEYYCNENIVSGEKVWVMVQALASHKIEQFPDDGLPD
jgi:hypothetical protein